MSGSTTSLYYEGPEALVVELERDVVGGDVILDVDDALVPKLLQVMGIREATKAEEKKARTAAEDAERDGDATDKKPSDQTGGSE